MAFAKQLVENFKSVGVISFFAFAVSLAILSIFAPTQVQGYDIDSVCDICSFYAGDLAPGKILVRFKCVKYTLCLS